MEVLLIYLIIGAIASALFQFFLYKKEGSEKYFENPFNNLILTLVVFLFWPLLSLLIGGKKNNE
jgi:hypothetical protein